MGIVSVWVIPIAMAAFFKKKVEDIAVFPVAGISVLFLFAGLLNGLIFGVYGTIAFTAVCALFILYKLLRDKKEMVHILFSAGSITILLSLLFFSLTCMGRGIDHADDLTHWGSYLKILYNFSDLMGKNHPLNIIQPEGILVWDYYILKTWIGYTESLPLAFHAILNILLLLPFLKYSGGKYHLYKVMALWVFILCTPLAIRENYGSFYADIIQALLLAYIFIALTEYVKEKNSINIWQMICGMYLLVSSKRAGIFVVACFMITAGMAIVHFTKKVKTVLVLAAVTLVFNYLWLGISIKNAALMVGCTALGVVLGILLNNYSKIKYKEQIVAGVAALSVVFFGVASRMIFMKDGTSALTATNYFLFLINEKYFLNMALIPVMVLFIAGLYLLYKKAADDDDRKYLIIGGGLVLSELIYIIGYLFLYVVEIAPENGADGPYLPSFYRYMAPCFYAFFLFAVYVVWEKYAGRFNGVVFLICLVSTLFSGKLFNYIFMKPETLHFYGFEQAGIELNSSDKILFIDEQDDDSGIEWADSFIYDVVPAIAKELYLLKPKDFPEGEYLTVELFKQQLVNQGYTYVYIQTVDDEFLERYKELFPQIENVPSGSVYEVSSTPLGTELVLR